MSNPLYGLSSLHMHPSSHVISCLRWLHMQLIWCLMHTCISLNAFLNILTRKAGRVITPARCKSMTIFCSIAATESTPKRRLQSHMWRACRCTINSAKQNKQKTKHESHRLVHTTAQQLTCCMQKPTWLKRDSRSPNLDPKRAHGHPQKEAGRWIT